MARDYERFILLTAAALLHAGLIYLNRHLASGAGDFGRARVAAIITRIANVAAVAGWGGTVIFIAFAHGQSAGYSVPIFLGALLLLIPVAILGHVISVALTSIQRYTVRGLFRAARLVARKASIGLFAAVASVLKAVVNALSLFVEALLKDLNSPGEDKKGPVPFDGRHFNYRTGSLDPIKYPGGLYEDDR